MIDWPTADAARGVRMTPTTAKDGDRLYHHTGVTQDLEISLTVKQSGDIYLAVTKGDSFADFPGRAEHEVPWLAPAVKAAGAFRGEAGGDPVERYARLLLEPVEEWCRRNGDRVAACYISQTEFDSLDLSVVGLGLRYDFDLGKSLSELDLSLFKAGWRLTAGLLPAETGAARLAPLAPNAVQVYGKVPAADTGRTPS